MDFAISLVDWVTENENLINLYPLPKRLPAFLVPPTNATKLGIILGGLVGIPLIHCSGGDHYRHSKNTDGISYEEVNLDHCRYLCNYAGGSFFFIRRLFPAKEEPVEPTATPHVLQSLDDQALKSIIYHRPGWETVVQLDKVDTLMWTVATHPDGVVTAGNVEEIISYLSELQILIRFIGRDKDFAEMSVWTSHSNPSHSCV